MYHYVCPCMSSSLSSSATNVLCEHIRKVSQARTIKEKYRELKRTLQSLQQELDAHVKEHRAAYARNMIALSKPPTTTLLIQQEPTWKRGDLAAQVKRAPKRLKISEQTAAPSPPPEKPECALAWCLDELDAMNIVGDFVDVKGAFTALKARYLEHVVLFRRSYADNMVQLGKINDINASNGGPPPQIGMWKLGDLKRLREPPQKRKRKNSRAAARAAAGGGGRKRRK